METVSENLITERLAYPSRGFIKYLYKSPILLYRLGLGALVGRLFMIMTTNGRKSGLPRHTVVEFHQHKGRKYVIVGWTKSDWYQNILANPLMTIQTAFGTEHVRARRVVSNEELVVVWEFFPTSPSIQWFIKQFGVTLTQESFLEQKDHFIILTFERTDEATPAPLKADLRWVLPATANILMPILIRSWVLARRRKQRLNRLSEKAE